MDFSESIDMEARPLAEMPRNAKQISKLAKVPRNAYPAALCWKFMKAAANYNFLHQQVPAAIPPAINNPCRCPHILASRIVGHILLQA
jgi:hypothetical protein